MLYPDSLLIFLLYFFYAELKMAEKQHLLSKVRKEFEKNPVTSNVVFSFILYCLEKLLEWEFVCPCNPELNVQLAVAFFFVPAFLVFLLMIIIQGCTCKNVCLSFIPAIVWLILVFLDGKYFACWKTSWSGKYETVSGSSHLKWCKPADQNPPKEFLETTQYWFSVSQVRKYMILVKIVYLAFVRNLSANKTNSLQS